MTNQEIANRYRVEHNKTCGVVIIYQGAVAGWTWWLRDPSHWQPGCLAVSVDGRQWVAVGGNEMDGAELWERVKK